MHILLESSAYQATLRAKLLYTAGARMDIRNDEGKVGTGLCVAPAIAHCQ